MFTVGSRSADVSLFQGAVGGYGQEAWTTQEQVPSGSDLGQPGGWGPWGLLEAGTAGVSHMFWASRT